MSEKLLVRMQIPVSSDDNTRQSIAFKQWLPMKEEDAIILSYDDLSIKLWFDLSCVESLEEISEEAISKWNNVRANKVNVDIGIDNVPDDLAEFIYTQRDWYQKEPEKAKNDGEYERLFDEYHNLGRKVLQASVRAVNRMLSYFRNYKLQYWIEEYKVGERNVSSYALRFKARVKIKEHDWITWYPATRMLYGTVYSETQQSLLERNEWSKVASFVNSRNRPSLQKELLANAFSLAGEDYARSALIEAVSALEAAIFDFAKAPNYPSFLAEATIERIADKSLASQVEHLGLRGTVWFLFPIIFALEVMPTELLKGCQEAVDVRNSLVHHGRRTVDPKKVWAMLRSINGMCQLLEDYTSKRDG